MLVLLLIVVLLLLILVLIVVVLLPIFLDFAAVVLLLIVVFGLLDALAIESLLVLLVLLLAGRLLLDGRHLLEGLLGAFLAVAPVVFLRVIVAIFVVDNVLLLLINDGLVDILFELKSVDAENVAANHKEVVQGDGVIDFRLRTERHDCNAAV